MPGDPWGGAECDQTATWTQISSGDRWAPILVSTAVLRQVPGWMDGSWGVSHPVQGWHSGSGREDLCGRKQPSRGLLPAGALSSCSSPPHASPALTVTRPLCCAGHVASLCYVGAFVASTHLVFSAVSGDTARSPLRLGLSAPLTVGFVVAHPRGCFPRPFFFRTYFLSLFRSASVLDALLSFLPRFPRGYMCLPDF